MRRLSLLAALALAPLAARAQQADTHAIVGARVVTVSGPVHERATVVMRDGLIEAVGPDVTPPPGARVIDGKGLAVTPGLIDAFRRSGLPAPARPRRRLGSRRRKRPEPGAVAARCPRRWRSTGCGSADA